MNPKLSLQTTKRKSVQPKSPKKQLRKKDVLIDALPLPRYFQMHFEYIHDNTQELREQVNQLSQTLAHLENKMDQLLGLLAQQSRTGTLN